LEKPMDSAIKLNTLMKEKREEMPVDIGHAFTYHTQESCLLLRIPGTGINLETRKSHRHCPESAIG